MMILNHNYYCLIVFVLLADLVTANNCMKEIIDLLVI